MDLSFGQKLEVGFIVVVLAISGFFFFRNTRGEVDMTVNSWTEQRRVPKDSTRPISAVNPVDPSKSPVVTFFACHDGRLEIAEYPADSGLRPTMRFKPDQRRESYDQYRSPAERVSTITDPYKKTITLAAYSAADGRSLGLLSSARMDLEQKKAERELRQVMMDTVTLVDEGAKAGTFAPELYDKVLEALEKYRSVEGDPTKDRNKAQLAHKVIALAFEYLEKAADSRAESIEAYIAGMDKVLTDEQKTKLGEFGKDFADRRTGRRPARAG